MLSLSSQEISTPHSLSNCSIIVLSDKLSSEIRKVFCIQSTNAFLSVIGNVSSTSDKLDSSFKGVFIKMIDQLIFFI